MTQRWFTDPRVTLRQVIDDGGSPTLGGEVAAAAVGPAVAVLAAMAFAPSGTTSGTTSATASPKASAMTDVQRRTVGLSGITP
ncbi:MAG TPA: hypothetical protein VFN19_06570 [Candidatus Nanopelagicales bacterium]|jgi:hypothetical protein|nr:hypothetical protein [Candidatus Nanopelagicales bacterium]